MNAYWAREVHYRSPFTIRRLPILARYYRLAFRRAPTRRAELFFYEPLRRFFGYYRSWHRSPCWGTFGYERAGASHTIQFDGRNVQFHALYSDLHSEGYEPEVSLLIDALLPEEGTFFDVGSNWGYFSLYAASVRARVVVHAFEPHPNTFRDLSHCVAQAGLGQVVTCHNFALSNTEGKAFIQVPDRLHSGQAEVSQAKGHPILIHRLEQLNLPRPNVIKMDVEGHELSALSGAEAVLRQAQPFLVFENKRDQLNPQRTLEPLAWLSKLGYRFFQPALWRNPGVGHLAPCGFQRALGRAEPLAQPDVLALAPLIPEERFLFQEDCNLLACHVDKLQVLQRAFPKTVGAGS